MDEQRSERVRSSVPSSRLVGCSRCAHARGAVALLVFLAAAARARIVAADLRLVAPHRLHRRIVAADARRLLARCGRAAPAAAVSAPATAAAPKRPTPAPPPGRSGSAARGAAPAAAARRRGAAFVVEHRPQPPQVADDLLVDALLHRLEQRRSFLSCTRPADRAGRSRAGRCLPSGGRGCRGGPSTARRRSAA